jgi:hypothetical protein
MAVSNSARNLVRRRAGDRCEYCHADERWQFVRFTIDHIEPTSLGGSDEPENLALACRNCNERRSNATEAVDPQTGEAASLFNPRRDSWNEHFAWSEDRLHVVALTPMGRATLSLLDFNDERHAGRVLAIRRRDVADSYHPPPGDDLRRTEKRARLRPDGNTWNGSTRCSRFPRPFPIVCNRLSAPLYLGRFHPAVERTDRLTHDRTPGPERRSAASSVRRGGNLLRDTPSSHRLE